MQQPKRPGKSSPLASWVCFIYLLLPARCANISARENLVAHRLTKHKSHPLLIGDGMRSASTALRIVLSTTSPGIMEDILELVSVLLLRAGLGQLIGVSGLGTSPPKMSG